MKRIVISSIVLFVVSMLLGFVVHAMLLKGDYLASGLMRSQEDQGAKFPFMLIAHVMIAVGFTLIYRRGRQDRPWLGQGVRFGLLWSLASLIPTYLIYHAVMPFSLGLIGKQIAFDTVAIVLLGIVVAFVNKE